MPVDYLETPNVSLGPYLPDETFGQGTEKNGCRDGFECDRGICIDNDLVCDNVNHCGDGSDERHSQFCSREWK